MKDTLAAQIESDIVFGVYGPGTRLTEDRIIERHDAKRHAVRAAFSTLEQRGLLVHHTHRGVEVVEFTPDQVDQLYQVRIILETSAAEHTQLPVDAAISDKMEQLALQHAKAIEDKDFRSVFALNKEFHKVQFSCCGNERLESLIEEHARIAQPIRVVKYDDADHMREVVEQHFEIIKAMRGVDKRAYVEATQKHLPASAEAYRRLYKRRFGTHG
ncbi:GntR family transcriptional regulator [Pseudahrensia aquimaris]|uniref:GntR family transcriptional regulator n=1 Tax=Pseudahrensia aquimaris TaxID=744461 RepID=A0ABW3FBY4_9HYPH